MAARRVRARRGSGSIQLRTGRLLAQVALGSDTDGRHLRRATSFDSRTQAEACIDRQQHEHHQLADPVTEHRLADNLRWWLAIEAPKGEPGRRLLARTTLANDRVIVGLVLAGMPADHALRLRWSADVDVVRAKELAEVLDRLEASSGDGPMGAARIRARRGSGSIRIRTSRLVAQVSLGTDASGRRTRSQPGPSKPASARTPSADASDAARASTAEPRPRPGSPGSSTSIASSPTRSPRTGSPTICAGGSPSKLRWRDLNLASVPPRLTVVWQLDRWGELVHPKTAASRRTIPSRTEVAVELETWRHRQQQRSTRGSDNVHRLP